MKPYFAIFISSILLVVVWQLPYQHNIEEAEFYQRSVELFSTSKPVRMEGVTKIRNGKVIHIASLSNASLSKPIVMRFKGELETFANSNFSILGKINLLSLEEVRALLNHSVLSPYLLLEDETVNIEYTLLFRNKDFSLVYNNRTKRTTLLARR
ncbi:hypothetical protein BS333_06580 [Vibrio azureus]|uniref:Uncharacterized protein n=1 Tax=Vibrio azureus NBRC 104587 TaxID=1219077 RepID=U3C890_9VIBR|nr:hypothetical protein [Vibrio azureus]AUI86074.1 hypothetical protein BS333_06580 [Vibrio azureus]GAD74668.1 hypothetical protein VAZ01S_013_00750 [Vibrio azureus NBRC 104587]